MASTPVAPAQATTADVRVWLQTTIAATAFGTFLTGVVRFSRQCVDLGY